MFSKNSYSAVGGKWNQNTTPKGILWRICCVAIKKGMGGTLFKKRQHKKIRSIVNRPGPSCHKMEKYHFWGLHMKNAEHRFCLQNLCRGCVTWIWKMIWHTVSKQHKEIGIVVFERRRQRKLGILQMLLNSGRHFKNQRRNAKNWFWL